MKGKPETDFKWISVGYGIFSLGFIGITAIIFSIDNWRGFQYFVEEIQELKDIASMIMVGFLVSVFLCIGSWNLLKLKKPAQYFVIASSVGVAGLLLMNILPHWVAWMQGNIQVGIGINQMLSSSGFSIGYTYLAAMLVITYRASNKKIHRTQKTRR